jgi:hypothetical protein
MDETKISEPRRAPDAVAIAVTLAVLGAGLYAAFVSIDGWAVRTFARPILASALIAVLDVALLGVAVALAPALSAAIRGLVSLSTPRRSAGSSRGSTPGTPGTATP